MTKQKVIGYIRVSTEQQTDEGVSLDAQEAKIRSYCDLYELDLIRVEVDAGKSAKSLDKRPGLAKALKALASGEASAVVITKIDRLSRSIVDMGLLVQKYFADGSGLISIAEQIDTGSATGRMFLNMITMFSQYERELIGERTSDALSHLKDAGVTLGAPALGWAHSPDESDLDAHGRRRILPVPGELETVARILDLKSEGHSLRGIAKQLNADAVPTKRGGKWHPGTVRLVLGRAAVAA